MKQRTRLDKKTNDFIKAQVAKLAAGLGVSEKEIMAVFTAVYENSTYEVNVILARMNWLLSSRKGGINLAAETDKIDIEKLTGGIIYPKEPVFNFIRKRTRFSKVELEKIYNAVRNHRTDDVLDASMPDFTDERILQEMKWWLVDLDFPAYYFETTPLEEIGNQIRINRYHEISGTDSEEYANLKISYKSPSGTTMRWVHKSRYLEVEEEIERECKGNNKFIDVSVYQHGDLFLYLASGNKGSEDGETFEAVRSEAFVKMSSTESESRYKALWEKIVSGEEIAMEYSMKKETGEHRFMLAFSHQFINHFLSNISRILEKAGIKVGRKYCHIFGGKHPVVICSFYSCQRFPENIIENLVDVSIYPDNIIARLVEGEQITPREADFANCVVRFVHQFIRFKEPNIELLKERLGSMAEFKDILRSIQRRTDKDNYAFDTVIAAYAERPDVIKALYAYFSAKFMPKGATGKPVSADEFEAAIKSVPSPAAEQAIFTWGKLFVDSIVRTNFFLPVKSALSFRLDSGFLAGGVYEVLPYGIYFVQGRDFFGFHVRFKDISRGGIRIVKSQTQDDYRINSDSAFEECYNLAFTQNKKNKDIPEGGSKGIVMLNSGKADKGEESFKRYVDSILDILLPANKKLIANFEAEVLFLGPDEGSADLMDWACERARDRKYDYWKGFTTGKSAYLGGVSHIEYGMTTAGVHQYVLGILGKLGVAEDTITKAQTGGPDGDLGSNEILISRDKTIVIIDGGGVLYDPAGLDRKELKRLAERKLDSSHFNGKLSPAGFKVTVNDKNVTLPDGSVVGSGVAFRNSFHLDPRMKADLFVPCGGRPRAINAANWKSLLDADGKPIFKWIVEGANLFITQDARIKLEEKGVILFKDSSTNKGGVTSSSLEVLAGLALDDATFAREMVVAKTVPKFREKYIAEIIGVIKGKAHDEFEILWKLHAETGRAISDLSDDLSQKINEITSSIEISDLFNDKKLRVSVLLSHIPASLVKLVGIEKIMTRIPLNYQKAIFARRIADGFVYKYGLNGGYEEYRRFINDCY